MTNLRHGGREMLALLKNAKKQKGFTLVELMIVVAIIGILAAIAIPNFRNYQLKAKRGELPTNLKAIKTSQVAYQAEFDSFLTCTAYPVARTAVALNNSKNTWTPTASGGFQTIGWAASGDVYGAYQVTTASGSTMTGMAASDIDDDGTVADYTVTESAEVTLTSGDEAVY